MSDNDEDRPLTRRELRLRAMAAAGESLEQQEDPSSSGDEATAAEAATLSEPAVEIDIPLVDESGRVRSRRELRELRAQAEAELAREAEPANEEELEEPAEVAALVEPETEAELEELSESESEDLAEVDLEDLFEAEPEESAEAETEASVETELVAPAELEESAEAELEETAAAELEETAEAEAESTPAFDDAATVAFDVVSDQAAAAEEQDSPTDETNDSIFVVPADEAVVEAANDHTTGSAVDSDSPEPISVKPGNGYSFPDIAPLDEGRSVFDDPAIRMMGTANDQGASSAPSGDFDELISRAVAQEGGTSSNTSALILPNMPENEGLAGPLDDTGELYITGSIELPKSLGETGGHSALHESVDADPFDLFKLPETDQTDNTMAPVSASQAVSARGNQGPLVAEATKDKSKVPVALIATGGVLVVAAAGLIIWAATSGLFG